MGITHRTTASYMPQENPTERANRTIKTLMSQTARDEHRTWDEMLLKITLAINTAKSDSTNYTPAYLVQWRVLRLPANLFVECTPGTGNLQVTPAVKAEKLQRVFKINQHNLQQVATNQAKYYNLRRRNWRPWINQLVWVRQHSLSNAKNYFSAKLAPKFDGPFKVQKFISPVLVELSAENTATLTKAHIADLRVHYGYP
ncbi:uncharacterized protein LOC119675223 [Teleopsis dalmanni]|uniref:uncharacterized protein LOC119675223 n=1 Tax=Teleopsis dalmanni TaxID=139649 RepID=UPI0018CD6E26|nr:uncharacterized protein LOC119675223 [Teleopsis dalmanni]